MSDAQAVLEFWLEELSEKDWFDGGPELDAQCRARFEADWQAAMDGQCESWRTGPRECLGYILLTDQMPRNMYRGTAQAYASDWRASAAAYLALNHDWDLEVEDRARHFFYMPFVHAESLSQQERAVRLMVMRRPGGGYLRHARAHREVIRRFGRFPHRNADLGRKTTAAEQAFIDEGGYRAALQAVDAA